MREVMHPVKPAEELRVMHQAMRPVEVRVVQENRAGDAQPKPRPAILRKRPVELGVATPSGHDRGPSNRAKYYHRHGGITHLAPDLLGLRKTRHDLAMEPAALEEPVAKQPGDSRPKDIPERQRDGGA